MKPKAAVLTLLALLTVCTAVLYQAAARERDYRQQLSRGDAARRDEQTFAAIEAYSAAIGLRPDSMLAHLRRAETYLQRGDLDAAARDFREASSLDPAAPRPLEELGDVLFARQRFDAAADAYEKRLLLDDRSAGVSYKLALSRYRNGNLTGALSALVQTIRLNDRLSDAYYLRGLCLRDQHRPAEAVDAFERAAALSPATIPPREELADLYRLLGRHADELEQLQLLASLDRRHVERQVAVGLAHARAGRTDLAVLALGNALEGVASGGEVKTVPVLYGALGRVWLEAAAARSDALSKALEALGRAATSESVSSEVLALYGEALIDDNQWAKAEEVLKRATEHYPIEPTALVKYATVAEHLNHLDTAKAALASYRALRPDDSDVTDRVQGSELRSSTLTGAGEGPGRRATRRQRN
jgi:tetratricopeptide (TPR) repeat protein